MKRRTKKRLFVLLLIPVLAALAAGGYWAMQARRATLLESARVEGLAAYERQDYDVATARLGYFVARDKSDGEVLLAFADCLKRTPLPNNRHLVRAVAPNRLAVDVLPGDPRPLRNLVDLYSQLGFERETLTAAQQLLELNSSDERALQAVAFSQLRLGDLAKAREAAETMQRHQPTSPWALAIIVETRLQAGESARDIEESIAAVAAENPDDIDVLLTLARVQIAAGEVELARETFRVASTKSPADADQARRLLAALDATGMGDMADGLLNRLDDPALATLGAERLYKQGRFAEARQRVERSIASVDQPSAALLGLGSLLGVEGAFDRLKAMSATEDTTARSASDWLTLIECERSLDGESLEDVVERLRTLQLRIATDSQLDLRSLLTAHFLAAAYVRQGSLADALASWSQLLAVDASWTLARAGIVTALLDAGRSDEAYLEAIRLLLQAPGNSLAARVYLLATSQLLEQGATLPEAQAGRLTESIEQLREAVRDDGDLLCIVTQIQLARADLEGARETARLIAAASRPPSGSALARLALAAQGVDDTIGELVRSLVSSQGGDGGQFAVAEAIVLGRKGDLEGGLRLLDEAIAASAPDQRLALERARAQYLRSVDQRRALDAMRELASREHGNASVQADLLNNPLAWQDCAVASEAVRRLGAIVGEESSLWRVFESRRLLECAEGADAPANALLMLTAVLVADPMAVEARLLAAEADLRLNDRASAITRLSDYVNRGGRDVRVHLRLIPLLREAGRPDAAREIVNQAASIEPIPLTLRVQRGAMFEQWGMRDRARAEYAMAAEGGDRTADLALVGYAVRTGDTAAGSAAVERLRAREDLEFEAQEIIAAFEASEGDLDRAMQTLRSATVENEDDRAIAIARLLRREGRDADAVGVLLERAEAGGGPRIWSVLISMKMEAGEIDRANELLGQALARYPAEGELEVFKATLALLTSGSEQSAEALARINDALERQGAAPEMIELGRTHEQFVARRISPDDYIVRLRALTTRYPTSLPVWRALIAALMDAAQYAQVADAAQAMLTALPTDVAALRLATEAFAGARRYQDALAVTETWRRYAGAETDEVDLARAQLFGALGRPADALASIAPYRDQIVAESEAYPGRLALLAELEVASGQSARAQELLQNRSLQDVAWAQRHVAIGASPTLSPAISREWLRVCEASLIEAHPSLALNIGDGWRMLGQRTNESSDYREATRLLGQAAASSPTIPLLVTLAEVQAGAGDIVGAESSYRSALAMGDDAVAMNNLSALLAEHRPDDPEARTLASRALEIARAARIPPAAIASFCDTLGYAELRAGRFEEALRAYEEAVRLDPSLPDAWVGLAETHMALGDRRAAQTALDRLVLRESLHPQLAERESAVRARLSAN